MFAMVLANIGSNMYEPLLPIYLRELNANVVQVGLFFTLAQIIPLALQILGGWISDSLGRLRSIAFGSLAGLLSYIPLILAPSWQWVLLGEGMASVTRSLVAPSFMAFIAEESHESSRGRVFGITETIFMVVAVIGPPLGGWLAGNYGFRLMLVGALLLYIPATVIRVLMARNAARTSEFLPQKLTMKSLKLNLGLMLGLVMAGGLLFWILITDGIGDIVWSLSHNLLPLYMEDIGNLSIQQISWIQSIMGVFIMLITIPAGWLADNKGEKAGIAIGFILQFLALITFVNAGSFGGFALSASLLGLGIGTLSPAFGSLISKALPARLRGTGYGLFSTSLGLISLPAPAIGAQLWQRINPRFPFVLAAVLSLLAAIPAWFKLRLPENHSESETDYVYEQTI